MKASRRWLLVLAVGGPAVGIPVTFNHAKVAPLWTLALPLGVVFVGLYLVAFSLQKEVAQFDAEQRSKMEWARGHDSSGSDAATRGTEASPKALGGTAPRSSQRSGASASCCSRPLSIWRRLFQRSAR